jgi:hypothetical protein
LIVARAGPPAAHAGNRAQPRAYEIPDAQARTEQFNAALDVEIASRGDPGEAPAATREAVALFPLPATIRRRREQQLGRLRVWCDQRHRAADRRSVCGDGDEYRSATTRRLKALRSPPSRSNGLDDQRAKPAVAVISGAVLVYHRLKDSLARRTNRLTDVVSCPGPTIAACGHALDGHGGAHPASSTPWLLGVALGEFHVVAVPTRVDSTSATSA